MHIPLPWAVALVTAGALLVVVMLGIAVRGGHRAGPGRGLAHLAYLLGGGVAGFVALAFPPSWVAVIPVTGVLIATALRDRRVTDVGLLVVGIGVPWVLLLGASIIADATDRAVHGSGHTTGWFLFGAAALVGGLLVTIAGAASSRSAGR